MREDFEPFENAEEDWFWFCGCIMARDGGLRSCNDFKGKIRNCEVADIYRIIKKMKLNHQITNRHLRVMVKWGQLECSPYYHYRAKRSEIRLWDEGLHALEGWLLSKGIITL